LSANFCLVFFHLSRIVAPITSRQHLLSVSIKLGLYNHVKDSV